LAVIGADAGSAPVTTGNGSSQVTAPFVSTPLAAIRRRAGTGVSVTYADGGSTTGDLPAVPTSLLTPAVGRGHGLTLTLNRDGAVPGTDVVQSIEPTVDATLSPHPTAHPLPPGVASTTPVEHRPRRLRLPTTLPGGGGSLSLGGSLFTPRSHIVLPAGWSDASADWTGTLTPPSTGLYTFSLQGSGAATLTLDGQTAVSDPLSHATGRWSQTVPLVGGHPYRFDLSWEPVDKTTPSGETTVTPSTLTLGFGEVSGQIARAVAAARRSDVAVVFASDYNSEAFDRPSLSLPGDDDALIAAVAAANPRTVVVLNTGGPVLMPWLGAVAGVVEAWYPGEKDGAAIAALLFGDIDPSGRLPVTFPASQELSAVHSLSQWPGVDYTTTFSEGLDIGYRYDHATGVRPLFPFGFGLTYTRFALSRALVHRSPAGATLTVHVRNTGDRSGTDVVQAYLTDPATAGEPPAQLVAFFPVTLAPGERRVVTLAVPRTAFEAFLAGAWTTVPGRYTLSVGQSSSDLPLSVSLTAP
jgi:beta-glucosidase